MYFYYMRLISIYIGLKGLAQAKIIKKSVILFRVLNMTIWCKHVYRLELQIFIIFVLRIHQLGWDEIPDFYLLTTMSKIGNAGISSLYLV